ncbi:MAG: helix-turn-helix transcriptional regulator [Ktedonobacteraceae bacterium]
MIRLRIKEIALAKGLSQGKLSRKADVDVKTLRRIFCNPTEIVTTETLDKLAIALNVDASLLIESDPPLPKIIEHILADEKETQ